MLEAPLTAERFQKETNVSHETLARLEIYVALLRQWNEKINLVSRDSLADVWRRHVLDSAQLLPFLPSECAPLVDLGSGAGFPGLVLSVLGVLDVRLIESDQRKCVFLREAARLTQADPVIIPKRIEDAPPFKAKVITARAFASLSKLLDLAERFMGPDTTCLLLKGRSVSEELTQIGKQWKMTVTPYPSRSDPSGRILRLEKPTREFPGRLPDHA